jgi:hypothetical protein
VHVVIADARVDMSGCGVLSVTLKGLACTRPSDIGSARGERW